MVSRRHADSGLVSQGLAVGRSMHADTRVVAPGGNSGAVIMAEQRPREGAGPHGKRTHADSRQP